MNPKQENFIRISENRTAKILNLLSKLNNLTNASFYEYTDEQIESMFALIEDEINKQKKEFEKASLKKKVEL